MPTGTIVKGIGGFYYVKTDDEIIECKARGVFRKRGVTPLPGDRVDLSLVGEGCGQTGFIEKIYERASRLERPAVANVTQVLAVVAVTTPEPDLLLLDKLLVTAELKNLRILICLNKTDLDTGSICKTFISEYESTGYPLVATSCSDKTGLDRLKKYLAGETTVFAGQSGVGKSTLLNNIVQSSLMETGDISLRIGRGRHTTRHAQLISLDFGGFVLDTPGFSSYGLPLIKPAALWEYYPEFQKYLGKCRFKGCMHINEPCCAVKGAVESNKAISGRYARYVDIYRQLMEIEEKRYN